jgi:hypothetical protein
LVVILFDHHRVQGVQRADRELLDARAVVGHLVAEGSVFAFLAEHRERVFPDEDFADLFASGMGRPSMPAPVAASILTLQTLFDLSDGEAAEAARCDLRWKVATGVALDDKGFHPSTLVYWRRRLAKSQRPHRLTDTIRKIVDETGILRGKRRRAIDSTILDDAVATQDTVTQLIAAIRRVARQVPGAADTIAKVCTGHDYSQPGKPRIDWDDQAARDGLVSALVNDANAVVTALADTQLDEAAQSALGLLALVAGQDVEPAEDSDGTDGRWRIAQRVAEDRVISTVDTEARHTRKSQHARRDGYRAHVVAEPETGIVTDEQLTKAAGEDNTDPAVAEQFIKADMAAREDSNGELPREWYGDSAYGTADVREQIEAAGDTAVLKPKPLQSAVEGGFTMDDFEVNEPDNTVTCPAGNTRPISRTRVATFGALCRECPLRAQCTTSKTGRKIVLQRRDDLLRQARRDWRENPELREQYRRHRPNVERVISQLASRGGRRVKLRYRGTTSNNAWLKRRTAALNLRNLISRGLRLTTAGWRLATA